MKRVLEARQRGRVEGKNGREEWKGRMVGKNGREEWKGRMEGKIGAPDSGCTS
jgi:hypothetical protein